MTSDIDQLEKMETFVPLDANKLTNKDRNDDLASMILLTEKCMAQLKGEHVPMGGKNGHT